LVKHLPTHCDHLREAEAFFLAAGALSTMR
jgi:hypothetical protein